MKTIKTHLRVVAFFFSAAILFQGCTVYKSSGVSFDEAVRAETKVRVEKKNGEKVKYSRIVVLNDGNFYGVEVIKGLSNNVIIEEDSIEKIHIKDRVLSTILTVAIPVVIVGVLIGAVALSLENMSIYGN